VVLREKPTPAIRDYFKKNDLSLLLACSPLIIVSALCATSTGVYRICDAAPPGPESRDITEIDPRARAFVTRARRLCNVFIFFLPSRISVSLGEWPEITSLLYEGHSIIKDTNCSGGKTIYLINLTFFFIFQHNLQQYTCPIF